MIADALMIWNFHTDVNPNDEAPSGLLLGPLPCAHSPRAEAIEVAASTLRFFVVEDPVATAYQELDVERLAQKMPALA